MEKKKNEQKKMTNVKKTSEYYISEQTKNYKHSVKKHYNKKLSNTENLINGVIYENDPFDNGKLKTLIDNKFNINEDFVNSINCLLTTNYDKDKLQEVLYNDIFKVKNDLYNNLKNNYKGKVTKKNNASEMRDELNMFKDNAQFIVNQINKHKQDVGYVSKKCKVNTVEKQTLFSKIKSWFKK